jgi:enoyl-[acyl-carrier protein] reductase I
MDVSVHSFIRMARLAEPLMHAGGCLLTVSHYGAEKVVDHYNIMGPVKAALEGTARPEGYRVCRISCFSKVTATMMASRRLHVCL